MPHYTLPFYVKRFELWKETVLYKNKFIIIIIIIQIITDLVSTFLALIG